jgi:anti-anti-sigma factor
VEISDIGVPGLSLAVIEGRLDTITAPALEERLLGLIAASRVVLDMAAVRFVSSAGLRVLLKAAKAAKAAGTGFAVCALQPSVREVYDISGFERIITAHPTRDEAVAAFR